MGKDAPQNNIGVAAAICTGTESPAKFDRWVTRIPPVMSAKAERSEYCDAVLDVNVQGQVSRISAINCTDRFYEGVSRRAIMKWAAEPGAAACDVTARTSFVLGNGKGEMIPARGGLESWERKDGTLTSGTRVLRR